MGAIDLRVQRALFFCENDNAMPVVDGEGGDVAVAPDASGVPGMGMRTPCCPTKVNEYNHKQQMLDSDAKKKQKQKYSWLLPRS